MSTAAGPAGPGVGYRTDWSTWAEHADAIECAGGCPGTFQPNHPRRKYCGRDGCPGRARTAAAPTPRKPRARRTRRRRAGIANTVHALVADTLVHLHTAGPEGTHAEVVQATRDLLSATAPHAQRAATVRLLAVCSMRTRALQPDQQ